MRWDRMPTLHQALLTVCNHRSDDRPSLAAPVRSLRRNRAGALTFDVHTGLNHDVKLAFFIQLLEDNRDEAVRGVIWVEASNTIGRRWKLERIDQGLHCADEVSPYHLKQCPNIPTRGEGEFEKFESDTRSHGRNDQCITRRVQVKHSWTLPIRMSCHKEIATS